MAMDDKRAKALFQAIAENDVNSVRLALERLGENAVNTVKNPKNQTPLLAAIATGRLPVVKLLLEQKAEIDPANTSKKTMIAAVEGGSFPVIRALHRAGAELHITDDNGDTPLHIAASRGYEGMVRCLIEEFRVNPTLRNKNQHTAAEIPDIPENIAGIIRTAITAHNLVNPPTVVASSSSSASPLVSQAANMASFSHHSPAENKQNQKIDHKSKAGQQPVVEESVEEQEQGDNYTLG